MANILEVKQGLRNGKSYQRHGDGYMEYLTATGSGLLTDLFVHSVSGENEQGGYGGNAMLFISDLPGRFDPDGYEPDPSPPPVV